MEPEKSTKPSVESPAKNSPVLPDFDLPDGEDFEAFPPNLSMEEYHRRCRQLREMFPHAIPTEEERWTRKVQVEFEF